MDHVPVLGVGSDGTPPLPRGVSRSDPSSPRWCPQIRKGRAVDPAGAIPVLWIDDEVRQDDATVLLLSLQGFAVDVANTAASGLGLATMRDYRAIILDLRLPDLDGLDLLRRIAAIGLSTPVLILSGYLDVDAASAAVRLGVRDIRRKPMLDDELTEVVLSLVEANAPPLEEDHRSAEFGEGLTALRPHRQILLKVALRIAAPDLSDDDFIALASGFCRLVRDRVADDSEPKRRAGVSYGSDREKEQVRRVLATIRQELDHGRLPDLILVSSSLQMEADEIARMLVDRLGCNYRHCRRSLRIRPALSRVAFTTEQYSQIAYGRGYEHPTQFTRDFHETLGLTPHEFRALISSEQDV
jgi:FixJ family two-component response regulator/AraC-like DNA-binding protein